jgi:NAD(P)-dependent dehydrogenase (short-subunit alcohol dehydrogenase family)/uncharacterized protein YndB with AHSA1/START domain
MTQQRDIGSDLLKGQTAVVTGGGRGIGRAVAQSLAAAGAKVAILARSAAELAETAAMIGKAGGRARAFPADVTDAQELRGVLAGIERTLGPVDVLVNNAGILGPIAPFWETDPDLWWRVMEVNLRGPMLCARHVLPGMTERRCGRIINVASGAAIVPFTYFSAYVASKTALVRFTECLAAEARPYGIAVFAVEPGTVRTRMSEYSLDSPQGKRWIPWFKRMFDEGLSSPPERVAQRVLDLATGGADPLSGRFLPLSDDLDVLQEHLEEIESDKLYSLRINRFRPMQPNAALASLRAVGELAADVTLQVRRSFAASRERIFDAWMDGAALRHWFLHGTDGQWIEPLLFEIRSGGRFDLRLRTSNGMFHLYGEIRDVIIPEKLVMHWRWDKDFPIMPGPGETLVTIEFIEEQGGATLTITHESLPSMAARDAYERGWNRCLDGIAAFIQA